MYVLLQPELQQRLGEVVQAVATSSYHALLHIQHRWIRIEGSFTEVLITHEILEDTRSEREQRVQQHQALDTPQLLSVQLERLLGQPASFEGFLRRSQRDDVVVRPRGEGVEMSDDLTPIDRLTEH